MSSKGINGGSGAILREEEKERRKKGDVAELRWAKRAHVREKKNGPEEISAQRVFFILNDFVI